MGWVSAAMAVVGAVGQMKAAKQAGKIGEMNAANIQAETAESAYRLHQDQQRTESMMRARMAASGAKMESGSFQLYADAMKEAHARDLDWLRRSGASQASMARYEGKTAKSSGMWQAAGSMAKGVSGLYEYGSANWWGE